MGKTFTRRFQPVARALEALSDETVIDGEVVALDEAGRPSFNLQNYATSEYALVFYAFDVPILAGKNLMREPLKVRRELLRTKVMPTLGEPIRFSETLQAPSRDLIHAVREQGLEGIVAKRLDSPYEPGRRSGAWVKMRVNKGQELVIGRLHTRRGNLRRYLGRLFRGQGPAVCGQSSERVRPSY
jgi:ATP-dependent DNA ligase